MFRPFLLLDKQVDIGFNKVMPTPLHRILVNTVIEKDGRFLILQRSLEEEHMPGKWTIPGGKVEHTGGDVWNVLEENAVREVKEESGIEIENLKMIVDNSFIHTSGDHVVAVIFFAHHKSGDAMPLEDSIAARWITLDEFDNYDFAPNVKRYLNIAAQSVR